MSNELPLPSITIIKFETKIDSTGRDITYNGCLSWVQLMPQFQMTIGLVLRTINDLKMIHPWMFGIEAWLINNKVYRKPNSWKLMNREVLYKITNMHVDDFSYSWIHVLYDLILNPQYITDRKIVIYCSFSEESRKVLRKEWNNITYSFYLNEIMFYGDEWEDLIKLLETSVILKEIILKKTKKETIKFPYEIIAKIRDYIFPGSGISDCNDEQ